jgi:hypothetical protein
MNESLPYGVSRMFSKQSQLIKVASGIRWIASTLGEPMSKEREE